MGASFPLSDIHGQVHIKRVRSVRFMDRWFSAALTGRSCIPVLDWFNSSCHLIPDLLLDPFTFKHHMLKITHVA